MEIEKNFETDNYSVVRNVINSELANFLYEYLLLKRKVVDKLFFDKVISPFSSHLGVFSDPQCPGVYSCYGDIPLEKLLKDLKPIMEKTTNLELVENYSYCRIYSYGSVLHRHVDRPSCKISSTLNLGGDLWTIYLDPTGKKEKEGVAVELRPGDMLVYKGDKLEHWRYPFTGTTCGQVFFHYNDVNDPELIQYDGREFLGLPEFYKK